MTSETDREAFLLARGQTARLLLRGEKIECRTNGRTVTANAIRISSRSAREANFLLGVPGKLERNFRGTLTVHTENEALVPIIRMDRETAVASAVAAESPPGAGLEALKAQAVVSRSYYAAKQQRHTSFDFCDTTHCQFLRAPPGIDSPAARATLATKGLVLAYRGKIFPAMFSASCGGRTHTLAELGMRQKNYPYYSAACDYCQTNAPQWESRLQNERALELLSSHRSESLRIAIGRKLGWNALPGNNYSAHREGNDVVVRGKGRGHGLGLCQEGAAALAREGMGYQAILRHYFPNTTLLSLDPNSTEY